MGTSSSKPTTPKPIKPKPPSNRALRTIKKRRVNYSVDNPAMHELGDSVRAFSQTHPYGRCTICDDTTHNTIDHDATLVRKHKNKRDRAQTRSATAKSNSKSKSKSRGGPISPFICVPEGTYAFDESEFNKAWGKIAGCINVAVRKDESLFLAYRRTGDPIMEKDGKPRVYRDDWHKQWKGQGCCPDEVKAIAHDMMQELMTAGVVTQSAFFTGIEELYLSTCYAVIRVYLDQLEWEDVHESPEFEECLDEHGAHGVKPSGEVIVGAMLSDEPICKKMRLGKYTTRLVNAVRHEGESPTRQPRSPTKHD